MIQLNVNNHFIFICVSSCLTIRPIELRGKREIPITQSLGNDLMQQVLFHRNTITKPEVSSLSILPLDSVVYSVDF
jgi:hypothetical protein